MKLATSIAALGVISSASWLARAQPPESQPATSPPPPPIYFTAPGAEPSTESRSREAFAPTVTARKPLAAPRNALELSLAAGYTQGFGSLSRGVGMPSVATAGIGLDFGVGYRINERWAVLWTGQYQELTAERSDAAGGITSTVGVQYHLAPTNRTDPWVELGAGYRVLWESPDFGGPTVQTHGFQLVHVRAGLDFRIDEELALGPIIGADATMFRWQDLPYYSRYISDQRLSTFVYAGVQARFDIGGHTGSASQAYSKR